MAVFLFDTSGLVKRHVAEAGSAWVRSLVRVRSGHILTIAQITKVEVVAAITRRQRGGRLSPAQAGAILGHFHRDCANRYNVLDVLPAHLTAAMALSRRHGLRAYDAVQLAVAAFADESSRRSGAGPVTLVSADRELNAAASAEGLPVEDPNGH